MFSDPLPNALLEQFMLILSQTYDFRPPFKINFFQNGAQRRPKFVQNPPLGSHLHKDFQHGRVFLVTPCATPSQRRPWDDLGSIWIRFMRLLIDLGSILGKIKDPVGETESWENLDLGENRRWGFFEFGRPRETNISFSGVTESLSSLNGRPTFNFRSPRNLYQTSI